MNFKSLSLIAVVVSPLFAAAPASANDQIAQSLCSYVAANDKNSIRKTLSDNRLRIKNVYDGIQCDGLPLIRFAIKNNAADAAEFLVKQLPSSHAAGSGDVEWAQSNGFAASPVLEALKARAAS
jgi:hypothetical protein